ncbi:S9 family peptidase [Shewanella insulae]|uniref:S9 family peptidase n=1 Tax=Shewanella insulae TaxID=2681496 RepID=UPI001EFC7AD1|nr:S9 family peptidase [Shewanella insulae]MCG9712776.1 S9 family peptidase [Shewanella insulae]
MSGIKPPIARKQSHPLRHHGIERIDDYYWLRDDERQSPEVLAHLQAENAYHKACFAPFEPLQQTLFQELIGRVDRNESSVPYRWHGHWYYKRYRGDDEYPLFGRKRELEGEEQLLLDANQRAHGKEFYSLGSLSLSPDETLLAISEDTLSRRIYTISIKRLDQENWLEDSLTDTDGEIVWANDNRHLFYIAKDPQTLLGNRVFCHRLGDPQANDRLVYQEPDDSFYLSIGKSLDESRILLTHESTLTSEVSILDANRPETYFKPLLPREAGHEYSVAKRGEEYYIITNWQAVNFRLMKATESSFADKRSWQEIIPADESRRLEDLLVLKNYLVVQYRQQGLSQIRIMPLNGAPAYELDFDDAAYVVGLDVNPVQDSHHLRIYYASPSTPESIYQVDLTQANSRRLLKQERVLGGFDSQHYQTERLFIDARDGAKVPVTLVYRKDKFRQDGSNPLYQYGYGAYGYTIEPDFDSAILSLLDRGVVYAVAHIRGGEMLGRPWYDAGRLMHKQNSFNDFIDVTQALVKLGYCARDKVVASGGSAGGLLMGAVINQAPQHYLAVAAHVPFVDVVTTMLDESLPLTTNEYDEWGNPNQADAYRYMLSYSPYDNVSRQTYPHLLITTGLHDSQVQYFEPAKWVAKLREYKQDEHLLLFHIDMEAGHGGKSGRYRHFEDTAEEYAFFLGLLGLA